MTVQVETIVPASTGDHVWASSEGRQAHLVRQLEAVAQHGAPIPEDGKLWAHPEAGFKAGGITQAAAFWRDTLLPGAPMPDDLRRRALAWVTSGVDVRSFVRPFHGEFKNERVDATYPPVSRERNPRMPPDMTAFAREEVRKLLAVGAISVAAATPRLIMPVFVADNTTKLRLVYDARRLNCFCPSEEMTYESLRAFQQGLLEGDWMLSLDHKSGYHHIPLHPDSRELMGLNWEGQDYVWNVLPFGWAPACFVYNTLSTVVATYVRRQGIHTIVYLDDFGFALRAAAAAAERDRTAWIVMAVMYLAGYTVSLSKSRLSPAQQLILLGFGIDTVLQQYFVPEEKLRRILAILTDILSRPRTTKVAVAELQSVVGKLQALLLAVPCVGTFLVAAHRALSAADRAGVSAVVLPSEVLHDFRDLLLLRRWTRLSKWRLELHTALRMETDASGHGWGAILYAGGTPLTAAGLFSDDEAALNILVKEALAVTKAITSPGFTDRLVNRVLDLYTDNEIVRFTLLKGSTNYAIMRKIARELLKWQLDNNAHIRIHRVTTSDNVVADSLSRSGTADPLHEGHSEFRLTDDKFDTLSGWFGHRFTIDACASRASYRLPRFISNPREQGPPAVANNVFLWPFDDPEEFVYCYPPWALAAPLWRHFSLCHARGVMVLPDDPSQPWYGAVKAQAVSIGTLAFGGAAYALQSLGPAGWHPVTIQHAILAVQFDFRQDKAK